MQGSVGITNFTAGEWSPKMYGRVDIAKYGQACTSMLNMTLIPHGSATKRMGTEYVAHAISEDVRLVDFIFNTEQAYVLEFSHEKIRFFRDGGLLEEAAIHSPYTAAQIQTLNFCQSADVMYIVCPSVKPYKLTRPGIDTFAINPISFTGQPSDWQDGSWPAAVTFHQQRLWFGGAPKHPQKLWASKVGEFENLTTGTNESDGLSFSLVSERVNAVRWILSRKILLAGTSGGEWVLTSESSAAITNKNIQAERNSNYGTKALRPLLVGAAALYVSADGRRLRELSFSVIDDSYLSQDISLLAEHMTRPGIKELADCQNPDGIIWCVMRDGSLVGCTYLRSQEVIAWHKHETKGEVLSVACIPAEGFTETWFAVKRKNGTFIERMKQPWDGENTNEAGCWYLDSALLYEGEKTVTIRGLEHLEGEEVAVLAEGAAHPSRVVKNGSITLDSPAERALIGLPYSWKLSPMRIEGLSPRGTTQGKRVRITEIMARLYKTLGVSYAWAGNETYAFELPTREVDMPMDAAPRPYTGDAAIPMPNGWGTDARVVLSGKNPFPATIIMLVAQATVNE